MKRPQRDAKCCLTKNKQTCKETTNRCKITRWLRDARLQHRHKMIPKTCKTTTKTHKSPTKIPKRPQRDTKKTCVLLSGSVACGRVGGGGQLSFMLRHTVATVWGFFFFFTKMMTNIWTAFLFNSLSVSGHHKSKSLIDMIPNEIIYIRYENDRRAHPFYLCSFSPLSAGLGRVLCVSLQMCSGQITL